MKKQSLLKNFIFHYAYQGLILIIPFIISPYLTRTLMENALGTYTYTHSIAYYFVVAANLGIGTHGKRTISRLAGKPEAQRKAFWSLFSLHAAISAVSVLLYFTFITFFVKENRTLFIIQGLYVLSALFDITWLFYGIENFSSVVIKNAAVKVSECAAIFAFVKSPSDLWIYTLIAAAGTLLGQMVMLPQAMRIFKPIKFGAADIKQHVKPLLVFSVALIATSLYVVFDKTLLGILATAESVAFYEYSSKVINIPKTFAEGVSTVMFPRSCKLAADGNISEQKRYIRYSFWVTSFIGMASVFGLNAISELFVRIYYGSNFMACAKIINVLSPLVYIISTGKILRSQILIPNGMDIEFNKCILYNAIINLILSSLLIPKLDVYGAVIGTLAAELFGFTYQMVLSRSFVDLRMILETLMPFVCIGCIMYLCLRLLGGIAEKNAAGLLLLILAGGLLYSMLSAAYFLLFHPSEFKLLVSKIKKKVRKQGGNK